MLEELHWLQQQAELKDSAPSPSRNQRPKISKSSNKNRQVFKVKISEVKPWPREGSRKESGRENCQEIP